MKFIRLLLLTPLLVMMAACTVPPSSTGHSYQSKDGFHLAHQLSMHTGVAGTPTQTVLVMYNKKSSKPIAMVNGQSKVFSDKLIDSMLALGPAIVHGEYLLKAEKINCPPGTLCGTLVQVSNQAGSEANADATSSTQTAQAGT